MIGPAQCSLWMNRSKIRSYDFCMMFLRFYGSDDRIKERKRELKNTRIDWQKIERY